VEPDEAHCSRTRTVGANARASLQARSPAPRCSGVPKCDRLSLARLRAMRPRSGERISAAGRCARCAGILTGLSGQDGRSRAAKPSHKPALFESGKILCKNSCASRSKERSGVRRRRVFAISGIASLDGGMLGNPLGRRPRGLTPREAAGPSGASPRRESASESIGQASAWAQPPLP
jgi:hypothetical protein